MSNEYPPSQPPYQPPEPTPQLPYQPPPEYTQSGLSAQPRAAQPPRSKSRVGWIIAAIAGGVLIVCCIGALLLLGSVNTFSVFSSNGTSPPAATATFELTTVTASPAGPQPIFAPVLGGTVSDFVQLYGAPINPGDTTGGLWPQAMVADQQIILSADAAPSKDSQDGQLHVMDIIVQTASGATWNSSTQQNLMAVFLPSDAKFQRQQSTTNGNERIYTSAQLAATFNPNRFTNDAGTQTVAPGTLFQQCFLGHAIVQAGGVANVCIVTLGVYYRWLVR